MVENIWHLLILVGKYFDNCTHVFSVNITAFAYTYLQVFSKVSIISDLGQQISFEHILYLIVIEIIITQ